MPLFQFPAFHMLACPFGLHAVGFFPYGQGPGVMLINVTVSKWNGDSQHSSHWTVYTISLKLMQWNSNFNLIENPLSEM